MAQLNFDVIAFDQSKSSPQTAQQAPAHAQAPTHGDGWGALSERDVKLNLVSAELSSVLMKIDNRNPQEEQVLQYLFALHMLLTQQGIDATPVEQFYSRDAFERWKLLWSEELSEGCNTPPAYNVLPPNSMFNNALIPFRCDKTGMDIVTLQDRVARATELKGMWLSENDTGGKRAKQNREAQRRHRLRQSDDGSPESEHAKAIKVLYEEYLDACRQRKEAEAKWDDHVKAVVEQARQQRKQAMEQWAQHIEAKRSAWEQLKAQKPAQ
jgi:hypothetical protein